jgi:YfiH family protein
MENTKPFQEIGYKDLMFMRAPTIGYTHAFTTRTGGVSTGPLESLNLGESRGDEPERVRENYRRLFEALGIKRDTLCFTKQVHGNEVRIVTESDARELFSPFSYEADGIVTNVKGLPLICYVADCVPVLLADPKAEVVAAVHCGWRSTVKDILGVAVEKMISLGAVPRYIRAGIGPSIDLCCFETEKEVPEGIDSLLGGDSEGTYFPVGETGKFMVDLREANRRRLLQLGLLDKNIAVSDECTFCHSDRYWSARKFGSERGSQSGIIMIDKG